MRSTNTTRTGTPVIVGTRVRVDDPWTFVIAQGVVDVVERDVFDRDQVTVALDRGGRTFTYPCYLDVVEPATEAVSS